MSELNKNEIEKEIQILQEEIRILNSIDYHETKIAKSHGENVNVKLRHKILQGTYVLDLHLPNRTISFESERNVVKNWKSVILEYSDHLTEKVREKQAQLSHMM